MTLASDRPNPHPGRIVRPGDWRRAVFPVVFALLALVFALANPVFLSGQNLLNIAEASAVPLILALGMTLVVASGGIDLSIGIALDFGAAFAIVAMRSYGLDGIPAGLIGVAGGCLVGLFNAAMIVGLRISPFLATLCTFFIGASVQRIFTGGGGPIAFRAMPEEFRFLAMGDIFGIPAEIVLAAVPLLGSYLLLERSSLGPRLHAMGLQRPAAIVAGIRVGATLVLVHVLASGICALAGLIAAASIRMFTPLSGSAYLLNVIAAVFIGAAMHPHARPNVAGTLMGVLFLAMVQNGLNLMGLNFNTKDAASGIILTVALALAVWQRRQRT